MSSQGWETCFQAHRDQLKFASSEPQSQSSVATSKELAAIDYTDVIVLYTHWYLLTERLGCVAQNNMSQSEMLPAGWNTDHEQYTIQYVTPSSRTLTLAANVFQNTKITLKLSSENNNSAELTVDLDRYASKVSNPDSFDAIDNKEELRSYLDQSFHDVIHSKVTTESPLLEHQGFGSGGTTLQPNDRELFAPYRQYGHPVPNFGFGYGAADLNPFGGEFGPRPSGGMFFDPRYPRPRGSDFDPRYIPSLFRNPYPDHMPKPGGSGGFGFI